MGEVVELQEVKRIPPKQESRRYEGQRYTLTYDPNAPPSESWVYQIAFTRVYPLVGHGASLADANNRARRVIRDMQRISQRQDEE